MTSRTIVDLRVSLYKASITSSLDRNYFASTTASTAAAGDAGTVNSNPNGLSTTQSVQLTHHMAEVISTEVEVPTIVPVESTDYESSQGCSTTVEEAELARKYSNWLYSRDNSPLERALLIFGYLVLGVLFFPVILFALMVCCVSYFTPGIDD